MAQMDLHAKAVDTLKKLVNTVEATGGLIAYEDGTYGCAGDPDWLDLADAILDARAVLEKNGIDIPLTITADFEESDEKADLIPELTEEEEATRIQELLQIIARERISIENGAHPQLDDNGRVLEDLATCGTCGETWNDALISERTPAPSARCPYEGIHQELVELKRLRAKASMEEAA